MVDEGFDLECIVGGYVEICCLLEVFCELLVWCW